MLLTAPLTVRDSDDDSVVRPAARLSLLGGFELRLDGESVELPQSAQRLIAFLALRRHAQSRVFVAGSLWTEAGESQASSSLRSTLWRVRVRAPIIHATTSHLSLVPLVRIDVADAMDLARRMLGDDGATPTAAEVHAVCDAGELLPDWYDDWLIVERERVRQRRLHALEAACRRLTDAARYAEALDAGLAAIATEPLRETGHAAVIGTHLAEGNLVEASRQYETLRDLLRMNLGTHPSPRISSLLRAGQLALAS